MYIQKCDLTAFEMINLQKLLIGDKMTLTTYVKM